MLIICTIFFFKLANKMILLLSNSTAFKLRYCFMQLVSWYKAAGSSTTDKDLQVCSIYVLFMIYNSLSSLALVLRPYFRKKNNVNGIQTEVTDKHTTQSCCFTSPWQHIYKRKNMYRNYVIIIICIIIFFAIASFFSFM